MRLHRSKRGSGKTPANNHGIKRRKISSCVERGNESNRNAGRTLEGATSIIVYCREEDRRWSSQKRWISELEESLTQAKKPYFSFRSLKPKRYNALRTT